MEASLGCFTTLPKIVRNWTPPQALTPASPKDHDKRKEENRRGSHVDFAFYACQRRRHLSQRGGISAPAGGSPADPRLARTHQDKVKSSGRPTGRPFSIGRQRTEDGRRMTDERLWETSLMEGTGGRGWTTDDSHRETNFSVL